MRAAEIICHLASISLATIARKAGAQIIDPGQSTAECDLGGLYFLNATGASTLDDPFRTPDGPLSNGSGKWTWSVGTESYKITGNTTPNVTSVRQALWLDTDPPRIYQTPNLGYLGCGLLFHGLKQSLVEKAQNDTSGTCGSVLSDGCSGWLLNLTAAEIEASGPSYDNASIDQICKQWQVTSDWAHQGVPSQCADTFEDWVWIQGFRT